jgi:hypothetical protein
MQAISVAPFILFTMDTFENQPLPVLLPNRINATPVHIQAIEHLNFRPKGVKTET